MRFSKIKHSELAPIKVYLVFMQYFKDSIGYGKLTWPGAIQTTRQHKNLMSILKLC